MADYHRFVAYIYEYVNGKKMQNTGFAKIELRNAICRIQIHIQNIRIKIICTAGCTFLRKKAA